MGFVHVDKIPENGGQTLKEFLIDNHVDIGNLNHLLQNIVHQKIVLSLKTKKNLQEFAEKRLD